MKRNRFIGVAIALYVVAIVVFAVTQIHGHPIAVLDPKGMVAEKERSLIALSTFLMLIVVIPVFVLTALISWRYRASNTKATYSPEWDHNRLVEFIWWAIPTVIIFALSIVAWRSSHELDPFAPLNVSAKPMTVQVVALQWKWLFIYPEQGVASVNLLELPVNTPVNFVVTADAPMNSFWIPQLGGQIYAMPGMDTRISLMANQPGSFTGSSANISGSGFASMHFMAHATSENDFNNWVRSSRRSPLRLNGPAYDQLSKPDTVDSPITYSNTEPGLFDNIVMKFMMPMPETQMTEKGYPSP